MLQPQYPVTVVYDSPPLLKPKPIRPYLTNRCAAANCSSVDNVERNRRPTMVRASTLDGRTLSDVINAAHQASMNEKERRSRSLQLNQRGRFSPLEIQYDTNHHSSSSSISPAYSLDIRQNYNDRLGYESKSQPYYMSRAPSADDEAAYRRYPSY